jgi:hypothetical protein
MIRWAKVSASLGGSLAARQERYGAVDSTDQDSSFNGYKSDRFIMDPLKEGPEKRFRTVSLDRIDRNKTNSSNKRTFSSLH